LAEAGVATSFRRVLLRYWSRFFADWSTHCHRSLNQQYDACW